jgi:hypothetical protein
LLAKAADQSPQNHQPCLPWFSSAIKNGDHPVIAVFVQVLSPQGVINTSIDPSAVMLTWLVPASTSGVTGAESMPAAAFIIIGARMKGCG